jgi:hypothetical protein
MSGFALAALAVFWGIVRRVERRTREAAPLPQEDAAETIEGS